MQTLSKHIKRNWKLLATTVATPLLLTSCYYLEVLTVSKPGNDSIEEIYAFVQTNNFHPDYSFKQDSVGYHRLGYGIHKLESYQHFGSQIQIRIFDNNGNQVNGLSLCHGDFESKQFLGSSPPPCTESKSPVNSKAEIDQLVDHWSISEPLKQEFLTDVKTSDFTFLVVWNSSTSFYAKRIMKEVNRYVASQPAKRILVCYLNASAETNGTQSFFLQEVADTLNSDSRAIDIVQTAEHLMYFGEYGMAINILSENEPEPTTAIEEQRIATAKGVSYYMTHEYHKALENLSSLATDSLYPSIEAIVYVGKTIEKTEGPQKAIEYYNCLSINSEIRKKYISPRILLCEFTAQPTEELEKKLGRIRFNYPYSSEINYLLGKHSSINGNSKESCGYYESGSSSRELYPEYSRLCQSALNEHCNSTH